LLLGTFTYLAHKPARVPTPLSVIVHSAIWNKNHHQTKDDAYELKTSKQIGSDKDVLLEAVRGYFSCLPFQPQAYLLRRNRDTNTGRKEQWDMDKLTREDLQPGKFLFDHFEIAEVEENRIWLKARIAMIVVEVTKEKEGEAKVRMSTMFWDPKENKPPVSSSIFYLHLLYQRMLVQGAVGRLEK